MQTPPAPAEPAAPELLSYDQTPSSGEPYNEEAGDPGDTPAAADSAAARRTEADQKTESALFAYMSGSPPATPEGGVVESRPWPRPLIFSAL